MRAVQSLSGALTLDLRFPGQWFQQIAGLHYNWHRHYDATLGRYTQPDPLGFVDGPSVYGYARSNPYRYVDPRGLDAGLLTLGGPTALACPQCIPVLVGIVVLAATGKIVYDYMCMAKSQDNEYSRLAKNQPSTVDPCKYLKDLYDRTPPGPEREKIDQARKFMGCKWNTTKK